MKKEINRRSFIKTTAATSASFAFFPDPFLEGKALFAPDTGKTRMVEAYAPGVIKKSKRPHPRWVMSMMEKGMLALTGKEDLASAWQCFVKPDDVVGIKLNSGGGRFISTKKSILQAVVEGVLKAGVPEKNIVVWDQIEASLVKYYVKRQGLEKKWNEVQYKGCSPELGKENYMGGKPLEGFETEPVEFSWGKVKVADLVTKKLTAIINLPVLKDHACSGVTLALKNISHAVVDVPWHCHGDCCDPYIADIVNIPSVRDKLRLHILDGLIGLAEGGPGMTSQDLLFLEEKILFSPDPVALDTHAKEWIIAARKKMGFPPLEEAQNKLPGSTGRSPKHIDTAAARGLGTNDLSRVELVKLKVPSPEEEENPEEGEPG